MTSTEMLKAKKANMIKIRWVNQMDETTIHEELEFNSNFLIEERKKMSSLKGKEI